MSPKARLCVLRLAPPSGRDLSDDVALQELSRRGRELGIELLERTEISSAADFFEVWHGVCSQARERPQLVLVSSHGEQAHASNRLLVGDEFVDLDDAIAKLRVQALCAAAVVVDACNVDLHEVRGDTCPVAVLLANPGDEAIGDYRGGALTQSLTYTLGRQQQVGALLERTRLRVAGATKQRPSLRLFGTALPSLDLRLPVLPGGEPSGFVSGLIDASLGRAIPRELVAGLEDAADALPAPMSRAAHLVLAAHALLDSPDRPESEIQSLNQEQSSLRDPRCARARARALHLIGWWYQRRGDRLALRYLEDALLLVGSDLRLQAQICDTLGNAFQSDGQLAHAELAFTKSTKAKESLGDTLGLFMTTTSLGWTLLANGRFSEGEEVFARGLQNVQLTLSSPPSGANGRDLVAAIDAFSFFTVGLATALLIRGAGAPEFRTVRFRQPPRGPIGNPLGSWGSGGPHALASLLLAAGEGKLDVFARQAGNELPASLWIFVARFEREGKAAFRELQDELLKEAAQQRAPAYINAIAVASYLYYRHRGSEARVDLLRRTIEQIRTHNRTVENIQAWPWSVGQQSRRIETAGWFSWQPLQAEIDVVNKGEIAVYPTVTEAFLQSIAWLSALVLCLEGRVRVDDLWAEIADPAVPFLMGLSTSFRAAKAAAMRARPASEWGQQMKAFWCGSPWLKAGYEKLDDLLSERTASAHGGSMRCDRVDAIIARHQILIRSLSAELARADEFTVQPGGPLPGTNLRTALLVDTRSPRTVMDCEFLLATDGTEVYLPGSIFAAARGTRAGRPIEVVFRALAPAVPPVRVALE